MDGSPPCAAAVLQIATVPVATERRWLGRLLQGMVRAASSSRIRPRAGVRDAQPEPALAAGASGGDVEQPIAQPLGFGLGQVVV